MPPLNLRYLTLALCLTVFFKLPAQNRTRVDGFLSILEKGCSDSMFVRLNLEISDEFIFNNPDTSRFFATRALERATEIADTAAMARASNYIGICHYSQGHLLTALEYYQRSQSLCRTIRDGVGALKAMNNIGIIYTNLGEYQKAIDTYDEAFRENMALGHPENAAYNLFNAAAGYLALEDLSKARQLVRQIETLRQSQPIKIDPSSVLGEIYLAEHKPDSALICFDRAIQLSASEGDEYLMTSLYISRAAAYIMKKSFVDAELEMFRAERMIDENGMSDMRLEFLQTMADLRYGEGMYSKAYEIQKQYIEVKDSLDRINNLNRITELNARYESEKRESQIVRQEKMLNEKSSQFRLAVIGGGALCVFAALALVNVIRKKRINRLLHESNLEISSQRQKIISSIDYARRIQSAILPSEAILSDEFSEHFVYFRPKDIVSGDVYWCRRIGDIFYLAVIDCTGHGVPGAFMSLIAHSKLNKVIADLGPKDPAAILKAVHNEIVDMLHQGDGRTETPDGMDLSLCRIDLKSHTIEYSGANNPLSIRSAGELIEYKSNPYSIGGSVMTRRFGPDHNPFQSTTIHYQPGDELYMYTDGMFDQLGGPSNRKMNKSLFRELLGEISRRGFSQAPQICGDTLTAWRNDGPQTDDILIIGVRL
jgi:serine phosphatase RsbU (regulator of sigma subunit)